VLADDLTGSALRIMNVHYIIEGGPFVIVVAKLRFSSVKRHVFYSKISKDVDTFVTL
jgi:hypothetical protein